MSYSETALIIMLCCAAVMFVVVTTVGDIVGKHWGGDDE